MTMPMNDSSDKLEGCMQTDLGRSATVWAPCPGGVHAFACFPSHPSSRRRRRRERDGERERERESRPSERRGMKTHRARKLPPPAVNRVQRRLIVDADSWRCTTTTTRQDPKEEGDGASFMAMGKESSGPTSLSSEPDEADMPGDTRREDAPKNTEDQEAARD